MNRVSRCRPCVPLTHPGSIAELDDAIVTLAIEDPGAGTGRIIDRYGPLGW
ncbi:hypothetical protein ACH4KU_33625 [Streptomyces althioticus]|uniref:hypothetical protein n=1 Tax=Streptomyces althioticus TaxID=83380 RepID=UPI00378E524B